MKAIVEELADFYGTLSISRWAQLDESKVLGRALKLTS